MEPKGSEKLFHATIYVTAVISIVLGIVFYRSPDWANWPFMLILGALMLYLQAVVVRMGDRIEYSLSTAAVLPLIYLCGLAPAMVISAIQGIYDGIMHKKEWQRTMFNAAQFAICTFLGSLALEHATGVFGSEGFGLVVVLSGSILVYILANIAIVCLLVSIWRGVTWLDQIRALGWPNFYSNLSNAFIGIVFTFFAISYGFWGVVGFSALLLNLSGLLKAAAEASSERVRRRELEEELVVDEMTGAYNFRYLNNWLGDSREERMALLFIDIDDFTVYNNTYGHSEGDKVLRLFVETVNNSVRAGDRVVRYGGEEFVVLLKNMSGEAAQRVAERIKGNLDSLQNTCWTKPITVSIGISAMPQDTKDKHQLLLFADQAMYKAKEAGKDTIRAWGSVNDPA